MDAQTADQGTKVVLREDYAGVAGGTQGTLVESHIPGLVAVDFDGNRVNMYAHRLDVASPLETGQRVRVDRHAERGDFGIGRQMPFEATVLRVDGITLGEVVYIVEVDEGSGERWSTLASMLTPITYAEGDEVVVTEHAEHGTWGITEDFPFRATVTSTRSVESGEEAQYIVRSERGSTWTTYASMLTPATVEIPEPDERDTQIAALKAQVARLEGEVVRREREMTALVEDAHEYADKNNLCSEFDRFMADHGLPMREADYEVEVRFTVTARVTVQATSESEAQSKAEDEAMAVRSDMDEAISARTELFGVDTQFDEVGEPERQE